MLTALFFRLLRFFITGVICSLPIYLGYLIEITDNGILLLSFIAFVVAISFDAYNFSFDFWEIQDYYLGQLLPLVIYIVMGIPTYLLFQPVVFNRIFLPLRFAWVFGMGTMESIVIVSIPVVVIVTVLRFFGARAGRLFFNMSVEEDEDLPMFTGKFADLIYDDDIVD